MSILKPCPFCGEGWIRTFQGSDPAAYWDGAVRGSEYWMVCCSRCGAMIKGDYIEEVIENWNRRAEAERSET